MSLGIRTGTVEVDGAELYYERRGSGPALLMIPGAGGDAGYFADLGDQLASEYTVLSYDRRGNSRSPARDGGGDLRMAEQSRDALAVLACNGLDSALVFGNSGGAIIGLELATRHPEAVRGLVAHEPPIIGILPDAAHHAAHFNELARMAERQGALAAFLRLAAVGDRAARTDPVAVTDPVRAADPDGPVGSGRTGGGPERAGDTQQGRQPGRGRFETMRRVLGNAQFFMTHELRGFIEYVPDLTLLLANQVPLVFAGGRDSRSVYYRRTAEILAERLVARFVEFPGNHTAFIDDPLAFAARLREVLPGAARSGRGVWARATRQIRAAIRPDR